MNRKLEKESVIWKGNLLNCLLILLIINAYIYDTTH